MERYEKKLNPLSREINRRVVRFDVYKFGQDNNIPLLVLEKGITQEEKEEMMGFVQETYPAGEKYSEEQWVSLWKKVGMTDTNYFLVLNT